MIGAGITGLAFAQKLLDLSRENGVNVKLQVLEKRERAGGVISTVRVGGNVLEEGPDSFLTGGELREAEAAPTSASEGTEKPWARWLCERVGLGSELIGTRPEHRRSYVLFQSILYPVPEGFYMMGPTQFGPLLRSDLLSWRGKLRACLEWALPGGRSDPDESVADFVRRRFGREVLGRLAEPMIAGIYAGDAERLSLKSTFPAFIHMEETHGSVTRALLKRRRDAGRSGLSAGVSGPRYSLFMTVSSGLSTLIERLTALLPEGALRIGHRVLGLDPLRVEDGGGYRVHCDGETIEADAVCIAAPAYEAGSLLERMAPDASRPLSRIPYRSSATLSLGFSASQFERDLSGSGFVVPRSEGWNVVGCSFTSLKFAGRSASDVVLLRAFVGDTQQISADAMAQETIARLSRVLSIRGNPLFTHLARHESAMPQYEIGHQQRLRDIQAALERHPGLFLAGNAYRGIGMPDCIRSGWEQAQACIGYLSGHSNG